MELQPIDIYDIKISKDIVESVFNRIKSERVFCKKILASWFADAGVPTHHRRQGQNLRVAEICASRLIGRLKKAKFIKPCYNSDGSAWMYVH